MSGTVIKRCDSAMVNRRHLLLCLDAGVPGDVAADLCGFSVREQRAPKRPARVRSAAREPSPAPVASAPGATREFPLPVATCATTDAEGFKGEKPSQSSPDFFSEDELRVRHGPPSMEPLMPLSRLWPYLHSVLGHRRPGHRLHVPRAVARAARGLPLLDLPRRRVQRWAPQARIVVDRTLPAGFLTDDVDILLVELRALRGEAGLRNGDLVTEAGDIEGLEALPQPTLVLSDLGQLRNDRPLMQAWLDFGRRLQAAGVAPVALVPCPRDRWDPGLAAVWRCACWDRQAQLPPPAQGLEALGDPEAAEKAARRAERLIGLLAPAFLVEPELLRAIRCTLPAADGDIGSEFDVRVGGSLAVAGHDMALLPQTRKACADRFRAEENEALKRRVADLVMDYHKGYGPQLRAGEVESLDDFGAPVSPGALTQALRIQQRTNDTMLRDLGALEVVGRWGLYLHKRWELARLSRRAMGTRHAAVAWALLCRFDGIEDPEIPDGMSPDHVQEAMRLIIPDPGCVTKWELRLRLRPGRLDAYELDAVELRPCVPYRVQRDQDRVVGGVTWRLAAFFHLRRPHILLFVRRGERTERHSLVLSPGHALELPVGACDGISLRSDCSTVDIPQFRLPPWATRFAWDRFGLYVEFNVDGVVFRLRWIPPGTFMMGSPEDEPGRWDDEGPQHRVTVERGFWLGETPVTQRQYQAVVGSNPSHFEHAGPDAPVESVSWEDAQAFCERLAGAVEDLESGSVFRLPSEAEWEYACRAGTDTALYTGPITIKGERNAPELDPIAWYGGNSGVEYEGAYDSSDWEEKQYDHKTAGTHPVAAKAPNAFGLYDMLGNVLEWCEDEWHDSYEGAPDEGTAWEDGKRRKREKEAGRGRVIRGGSWFYWARYCRCAYRNGGEPGGRDGGLGFRLVLAPSSTEDPDHSP